MANINKRYSADIKGAVSVDEGKIIISVEDVGDIDFSEFIQEFVGKDNVKITVAYGEQLM